MHEPEPWSDYLGSLSRAPSALEELAAQPARLWTEEVGRAILGPPAVGSSVIAVQAVGKELVVLDRETGEKLWDEKLNGPGAGGPLIYGSRLYAATSGSDGAVYAFDLASGDQVWKRSVGPVIGPIAMTERRVLAATRVGRLAAINPGDGRIEWSRRIPGRPSTGPTVRDDAIYLATNDSLFRLAAGDGKTLAAAELPAAVHQPPALVGDTLILSSPDGVITGLDATTLEPLWSVETGRPVFGSPAVARDTVFVVSAEGALWRIPLDDPASAESRTVATAVRAPAAPIRSGVLVGTLSGTLILVGGLHSSPIWQDSIGAPIETAPVLTRGMLVVADGSGRIHTWR